MNLSIKKSNTQIQIVFVDDDRIDTTNLKEIQELLSPYVHEIQESNVPELELDFDAISFIDSSGLAMIINIYKKLLAKNQILTIINSCTFVQEIFKVTKLDSFINIR